MKGHGTSGGALTVINAIATGFGSAFGIGLSTSADVELLDEPDFTLTVNGQPSGTKFVEATLKEFTKAYPEVKFKGADVSTVSTIPQSKGLKSSSAAANAILMAAANAASVSPDPLELVRMGARAGIAAGVSVTGAFDDASACMLGGLVFTNNREMTLLKHEPMPEEYAVVIHLPNGTIPSLAFPKDKFIERKADIEVAFSKAFEGDIFSAMYENGRCVGDAIGIGTKIADRALQTGAKAAGISGTGPATGILVPKESLASFLEVFNEENCIITDIRNGVYS